MKTYFITGTDTNCGKTYVTRSLLQANPKSIALKPIASGCLRQGQDLVSEDALQLHIRENVTLEAINPWRFERAVSPHLAAKLEGRRVSAQEIMDYCLSWNHPDYDTVYIEGAGGLLVPLNEEETWIDFLKLSKIPVILVVGMKLGCINHSLLTQSVLEMHGIECSGWIANCIDPEMDLLEENLQTLRTRLQAPLLGVVVFDGVLQNTTV